MNLGGLSSLVSSKTPQNNVKKSQPEKPELANGLFIMKKMSEERKNQTLKQRDDASKYFDLSKENKAARENGKSIMSAKSLILEVKKQAQGDGFQSDQNKKINQDIKKIFNGSPEKKKRVPKFFREKEEVKKTPQKTVDEQKRELLKKLEEKDKKDKANEMPNIKVVKRDEKYYQMLKNFEEQMENNESEKDREKFEVEREKMLQEFRSLAAKEKKQPLFDEFDDDDKEDEEKPKPPQKKSFPSEKPVNKDRMKERVNDKGRDNFSAKAKDRVSDRIVSDRVSDRAGQKISERPKDRDDRLGNSMNGRINDKSAERVSDREKRPLPRPDERKREEQQKGKPVEKTVPLRQQPKQQSQPAKNEPKEKKKPVEKDYCFLCRKIHAKDYHEKQKAVTTGNRTLKDEPDASRKGKEYDPLKNNPAQTQKTQQLKRPNPKFYDKFDEYDYDDGFIDDGEDGENNYVRKEMRKITRGYSARGIFNEYEDDEDDQDDDMDAGFDSIEEEEEFSKRYGKKEDKKEFKYIQKEMEEEEEEEERRRRQKKKLKKH